MELQSFRRASELFEQICDLPEEEQERQLDAACGDDAELRALVVDLLRSDRDAARREQEYAGSSSDHEGSLKPEVPGYSIESRLGEGGMGVVWRATQETTRRKVALKVVSSGLIGSERERARFEREVELAAMLEHPGIARVYDSGVAGGSRYYAMELVEGVELDQWLAGQSAEDRQIVQLFERLCRAVEYAHGRGVIHRDLKPSNVLVREDGQPVVVDFGAWMSEGEPGTLEVLELPKLETVWSARTDEILFPGITLEFSPDGRQLALETGESLRIWDFETREILYALSPEPDRKASAFAYDPTGGSLAVAFGNEVLELDAQTFEARRVLSTLESQPDVLAYNATGSRLAAAGLREITLLDARTGEPLLRFDSDQLISHVEFSPDDAYLGSAGRGQFFRLWRRYPPNGAR